MLQVTPENLARLAAAGRLIADVKDQPVGGTGVRGWDRHYRIDYSSDGPLTLHATDNRFSLSVAVPVHGTTTSWSATVEAWRFDKVRYLAGGRLDIGVRVSRLFFEKSPLRLRMPLATQPADTAFPVLNVPERAEAATVRLKELRAALRFLVPGPRESALPGRGTVIALYREGVAMTSVAEMDLITAGPTLPMDLMIDRRDAQRLERWLEFLDKLPGGEMTAVELAVFSDSQQRQFVGIHAPAKGQKLFCPLSTRQFPRAGLD